MTSTRYDVVIVGAGHAGAHTAIALRQSGFAGTIALLGAEPDWPYERPPLTKDYLAGSKPFAACLLKEPEYWARKNICVMRDTRVTEVDGSARRVRTADETWLGYGSLVWAAGGRARPLRCPGADLIGVHTIRTRTDVDTLRHGLASASEVVVVGGGYIGLEAAAVIVQLGKSVTVVEQEGRVLARVAGETISRFFEAEHRARGVRVLLGSTVRAIEDRGGRACGVRLSDGTVLPADLVVAGIGLVPAVQPLLEAGAAGANGVDVDDHCLTGIPNVYAVGDCAAHVNRFGDGRSIRIESVQNAVDQALVAAKAICGTPVGYDAVPWFWSNQYQLRLQTVGLSAGHDSAVVRGDPAGRSFSVLYMRRSRIIALDCVNATQDYVGGKALVANSARLEPERLMDMTLTLRSLAASSTASPP